MDGTRAQRWRWAALALVGMLVLAACGSTVQNAARRAQGGRAGDTSLGADASGDTGGPGDAGVNGPANGGSGAGAGGTAAGGRSGSRSGAGAAGGPSGSASGGPGGIGPGITDTTINVGVVYTVNGA